MGRGRTTTGMVTACLIASTQQWTSQEQQLAEHEPMTEAEIYDPIDGPSEEEAYLQGVMNVIVHHLHVLSGAHNRGVQDNFASRWRSIPRQGCEATYRSRY